MGMLFRYQIKGMKSSYPVIRDWFIQVTKTMDKLRDFVMKLRLFLVFVAFSSSIWDAVAPYAGAIRPVSGSKELSPRDQLDQHILDMDVKMNTLW